MRLDANLFLEIVRHTPLISVDLIVQNPEGRVLLGLRNNRPAKDSWFVPGGRICKDERIDAAIARVAQEELGLDVAAADVRFVGTYEHLYDDNFAGSPGFGTHYIVLAHEIRCPTEAVKPDPAQHRQYRWFTPDEIRGDSTVHANTQAYFP